MKSDSQRKKDVLEELKWEPSVNASQVGVEVNEGIVTLAGHVNSYAEKFHAERAAQRVSGVRALAVEMDVRLPGGLTPRSDADIARTAQNALGWMTDLPKGSVKVMVENGWITLTPQNISQDDVKSSIEGALHRRAKADAKDIVVTVDGTQVTLTGNVSSWSERELAKHSAWSTRSVQSVVDKLTVTY